MDAQQLWFKIKHLPKLITAKKSGYVNLPKDARDFKLGRLFGGDPYKPLHDRLELKTLSIKDQKSFNTCVFNSAVAGKEIDEGVVLSVRSVVIQASRINLISGNGYSSLRSAQKILQDWGSMEEKDCPDGTFAARNDFSGYIDSSLNETQAAKHKTKTFWLADTKDQLIQALDQGRSIHAAMLWFTGYNQSGGFSSPWLITKTLGYSVGGHAVLVKGYDLNYYGKKVFIVQNSYSSQWGDGGKFYVEMDFFVKEINRQDYGAYVNLDLDNPLANFLNTYNGANVKGRSKPTIYRIQNGQKKPYLHEMDYFVWNIDDSFMKNFTIVDDGTLDKIPTGESMDITKSVYWDALKYLEKPLNITRIIEAIKENKK